MLPNPSLITFSDLGNPLLFGTYASGGAPIGDPLEPSPEINHQLPPPPAPEPPLPTPPAPPSPFPTSSPPSFALTHLN